LLHAQGTFCNPMETSLCEATDHVNQEPASDGMERTFLRRSGGPRQWHACGHGTAPLGRIAAAWYRWQ
jgi:hypothetical protein